MYKGQDAGSTGHAGASIYELIWAELDHVMDALMQAQPHGATPEEAAALRNQAIGLARALAILTNPYAPDIDAIRAQAVERWETKQ